MLTSRHAPRRMSELLLPLFHFSVLCHVKATRGFGGAGRGGGGGGGGGGDDGAAASAAAGRRRLS